MSIYGPISGSSDSFGPDLSEYAKAADIDLRVLKAGDTMSGELDMGTNRITMAGRARRHGRCLHC